MRSIARRVSDAEQRASGQICAKCRAAGEVTDEMLWQALEEARERMERQQTRTELLRRADSYDEEAERLRALAADPRYG